MSGSPNFSNLSDIELIGNYYSSSTLYQDFKTQDGQKKSIPKPKKQRPKKRLIVLKCPQNKKKL